MNQETFEKIVVSGNITLIKAILENNPDLDFDFVTSLDRDLKKKLVDHDLFIQTFLSNKKSTGDDLLIHRITSKRNFDFSKYNIPKENLAYIRWQTKVLMAKQGVMLRELSLDKDEEVSKAAVNRYNFDAKEMNFTESEVLGAPWTLREHLASHGLFLDILAFDGAHEVVMEVIHHPGFDPHAIAGKIDSYNHISDRMIGFLIENGINHEDMWSQNIGRDLIVEQDSFSPEKFGVTSGNVSKLGWMTKVELAKKGYFLNELTRDAGLNKDQVIAAAISHPDFDIGNLNLSKKEMFDLMGNPPESAFHKEDFSDGIRLALANKGLFPNRLLKFRSKEIAEALFKSPEFDVKKIKIKDPYFLPEDFRVALASEYMCPEQLIIDESEDVVRKILCHPRYSASDFNKETLVLLSEYLVSEDLKDIILESLNENMGCTPN